MPETVLFDRYRLLEPAGSGGSAEVWRAIDERTGEEVAVKRLHPIVFADEAGRRRLQREFDAIQSLDEPHIVRVRDLHFGEREAALVLDFVPGESLAQRLARASADGTAMPAAAVIPIVADVAAALAAAHAAGIVHRDVTPGNILLTPDGEARLTDFGIAHASGDDPAAAVTATGLLMGTMRYLAPEQLRGDVSTPASDLHGLAAVTYEMLAGHHAYEATSPVALAVAQQAGPAPIEGVVSALDAAVRRGLSVDPADRPTEVGAFVASLSAAIADEVTMATSLPRPDRTAAIAIPMAGAAAAVGAAGDDVGVASPARAAATYGPLSQAVGLRDRPRRSGSGASAGHRVPAPIAVGVGLLIAVGLLAAASQIDTNRFAGSEAVAPSAATTVRTPSIRPSPAPSATATPAPAKGKGEGKGNGKGKGD